MPNKYLLRELLHEHLSEFVEQEKKSSTIVQTLIFSKDYFKTAEEAKSWASKHGFNSGKVDETGDSFRLRQIDPSEFKKGSFRTIAFKGAQGVKAVIGKKA